MGVEAFSQRIAQRLRVWWGPPRWGAYRDVLHRGLRERRAFRSRDDPNQAWRCCALWQRTLLNKWNSREFAARHACPVPDLYWWGSDPSKAPLESLPSHFAVRPVWGSAQSGVFVVADGRELLRHESASPSELRERVKRPRGLRPAVPILIEEFVRSELGRDALPVEYKCHTFGDTVAAIHVIERSGFKQGKHRYYTADWEPFRDPMPVGSEQAALRAPPPYLDRMLGLAATLGVAVGTYMRVDFLGTPGGCLFNEFSSAPYEGRYNTPYCDELFGALWAERFPHAT
ncbi:MAG: hypothetical protein M3155_03310 [Actinomycetota bacterium]|nr:hypothetical protein [Actinomycetota bacterium]